MCHLAVSLLLHCQEQAYSLGSLSQLVAKNISYGQKKKKIGEVQSRNTLTLSVCMFFPFLAQVFERLNFSSPILANDIFLEGLPNVKLTFIKRV